MKHRARVTSKGRVTIPKKIRWSLGAGEGDSLLFEVDAGEARVSVERKSASFADYAGIWREGKGMSWEEVRARVRELRESSDGKDIR